MKRTCFWTCLIALDKYSPKMTNEHNFFLSLWWYTWFFLAVNHVDLILSVISLALSSQSSLESEKQKADDFERKYNEAQVCSEERGKKLEETEKKIRQLQESLAR